MSFSLDIAQDNTGGLCRCDVSANSLVEFITSALRLGPVPEKDGVRMKPRREMRHHLPAL